MKRQLLLILGLVIAGYLVTAQSTLSKTERTKAADHLRASQKELMETLEGLSVKQLHFKPSNDVWSIAECMEHIAISENNIFGIVASTLQTKPDPSLRSEVKMTDDQLITMIESRERKVKTRPEAAPNNQFNGFDGAVDSFTSKRKSNLKYVETTQDDLRNRYFDFPFGKVDAYQVILFMSGHTKRHIDQIKELMADGDFPNS